MKTHYIVIRTPWSRDHLPTVEHPDMLSADAEAERLTRKHPESRFRVYRLEMEWSATVTVAPVAPGVP